MASRAPAPATSGRRSASARLAVVAVAALWLVGATGASCAAGDAEAPPAAGAPDGEAPAEAATMTGSAEAPAALSPGRPVTLQVELSPELARRIAAAGEGGGEGALRLTVEGLRNPGIGANVRVFVNLPEAGLDTPLDGPHYLGDAGFFPLGDEARGDEQSFLFDLGAALAQLPPEDRLAGGRRVAITVVLVPPEGAAPEGEPLVVPFEGVRVEAIAPADVTPGDG